MYCMQSKREFQSMTSPFLIAAVFQLSPRNVGADKTFYYYSKDSNWIY